MNTIEKLGTVANSTEKLSSFVQKNSDEIFNFFINQTQSTLQNYRTDIDTFLSSYLKIIKKLDLSVNENQIFIDVLIDTTERLNLSMYFQRLYRIKEKFGLPISKKHEAISLYVNGLRKIEDFSNVLESLLDKLQTAYETEEDTNKRVLAIFFNFYANIIRDFGQYNLDGVEAIVFKIKEKKDNYSFLRNNIADDIFSISDITDSEKAFLEIHLIIDKYLNREIVDLIFNDATYLIELETEYATKLDKIKSDILDIRQLSCSLSDDCDDTFYSLGRGVAILNEEQQLYTYLKSYGNMHFAKCEYAYLNLPSNFFENDIEIIDWGCGQALASMTYLDFLQKKDISQTIKKITLVEPSEIALRRGALHVKKFDNNLDILTIHKDLNSLTGTDFVSSNNIKFHLFSNILDIDDYSTTQLANLIKENFKGLNYFVIISPKITDLKTNRIDNFIKKFDMANYKMIKFENKDAGEWNKGWTMVLRIFEIVLGEITQKTK